MTTALTVAAIVCILCLEGSFIARGLGVRDRWERALLSLPLAALSNVLLAFLYTIAGIPLSAMTITGGHLVLLGVLAATTKKWHLIDVDTSDTVKLKVTGSLEYWVLGVSITLILMNVLYSMTHAVLLPSNQYDSATNWTMRSEISFYDKAIAFDANEDRGMAKPQYPFLFHALQVTVNQGLAQWSDGAANTILYLLSACTFGMLYLMVKRVRGRAQSAATVCLLVGIPLLGLHLAQGYGDLNLAQYLLLSLCSLGLWIEERDRRRLTWPLLSAICIAAAVWTKSEGIVFGLVPWLLAIGIVAASQRPKAKASLLAGGIALALSLPWPIFAWAKGLSLTPHSSDTMISLHTEGIAEALLGLFSRGSFGIDWYAIGVVLAMIGVMTATQDPRIDRRHHPLLFIGALVFAEVVFVYLFTPNVRFLLNAESYYRQMMIPLALLILGSSFCIAPRKTSR